MSKPRVSLRVEIDTLNHAETIRDAISLELVGKDIFENHTLDVVDSPSDENRFFLIFNFRIVMRACVPSNMGG